MRRRHKIIIAVLLILIGFLLVLHYHRMHYDVKHIDNNTIQLTGYDDSVTSLVFSKYGHSMEIAGGDGLIGFFPEPQVINTHNWIERYSLPFERSDPACFIKFLMRKRLLVCYVNKIVIYNSTNGSTKYTTHVVMLDPAITSNEKLISGLNGHILTIRNMKNFHIIRSYKNAFGGAISPNGEYVAVGHLGYVLIYLFNSGKRLHKDKFPKSNEFTNYQKIRYSPDNKDLVVYNDSINPIVIDTKSWKIIQTIQYQSEFGFEFDQSSKYFVSLSDPAVLYSTLHFHQIKVFPNYKSAIMCGAFIPHSHKIAFGLQDGRIIITRY